MTEERDWEGMAVQGGVMAGWGGPMGRTPLWGPGTVLGTTAEARGGARAGWGPPAPLAIALSSNPDPLLEMEAEGRVQGRWQGSSRWGPMSHRPASLATHWPVLL